MLVGGDAQARAKEHAHCVPSLLERWSADLHVQAYVALSVCTCLLGGVECVFLCGCTSWTGVSLWVPAAALGLNSPAPTVTHAPNGQQGAPEHHVQGSWEGSRRRLSCLLES